MADEEHDDDLVERIDEQLDEEVLVDHQGRLDASAARCMEHMRQIFGDAGKEFDPAEIMSAAVRFYHCAVTGGVLVVPSDELRAMAEDEGLGDVPAALKLH